MYVWYDHNSHICKVCTLGTTLENPFLCSQTIVWANNTVAEVVSETIREAGAVLAGLPSGPLSAPLAVPLDWLASPLPTPANLPVSPLAPPTALLFLGGSKAPVDARASAASLEGEVLVVEYQPPEWDGKDLNTFISWEKIYGKI